MSDAPDASDALEGGEPEASAPEPERVHGALLTTSAGARVLHPDRADLPDVVRALRDDGFAMCLDVCGVDYLTHSADRALPEGVPPERFEVVVTLLSMEHRERIRIRVQVPASDPTCPTLFDLHPGSEAMEREVFDMFGIRFDGHPDLTRILMPEDWEGHPLRKDETIGHIPVQFKAPTDAR